MEVIKKETSVANKKELCSFQLKRTLGGIVITMKSEILEGFFKTMSRGEVKKCDIGWGSGMTYYHIPKVPIPKGTYKRSIILGEFASCGLIVREQGYLNFSFVKSVGLKDGITVECKGLFLQDDLDDFKHDFKAFITAFYLNYIKESSFEISITSAE